MSLDNHWSELQQHAQRLRAQHLRDLFAQQPNRFQQFSRRLDDMLIDFSKEKIDQATLDCLLQLAVKTEIESARDAMFRGDKINFTEQRAVLHTALRGSADTGLSVDGQDVIADVEHVKQRFLTFAEQVRSGTYRTATDAPFTDVINIGIGGSDLGPVMATQALAPFHDGPKTHFVSNVDGAHIADTLAELDPKTTLVIVASKTFTTQETMQNFATALAWLKADLGDASNQHLVAVSTSLERTRQFGIADERVFGFWDWVGGRYSLWSSVGLSIAIAVGAQHFQALLDGGRDMDEHFRTTPLPDNLPVLLALIGIWRRNALGYPTAGLMPYDQRLARFPAYVQQLDMESNGKRINYEGTECQQATGPIVWGEAGTNSQHSFFQLIHQGTDIIPVDFLVAANDLHAKPLSGLQQHHSALITNVLAQANALAFGRNEAEVREDMQAAGLETTRIEALLPHRTFPGDRPSSMIMYRQLDPFTLGRLIALFEHKVFVQGVIWGINSFDQWGVELGKKLATALAPAVSGQQATPQDLDSSTRGLIEHLHQIRQSQHNKESAS